MHYGWLIGLEDGNPFRNIWHLVFILTLTIFIPISICSSLIICFTCKKLRESDINIDQNETLESPTNYKWYKIYAAFQFCFYVRVMIQILMTVVLISHPLCKQLLVLFSTPIYTNAKSLYSFWWKQYNIRRVCSHIHVPIDIHCSYYHCLGTFYEVWHIVTNTILQCWVLQRYHIWRKSVSKHIDIP